jgi:hypothetical protein
MPPPSRYLPSAVPTMALLAVLTCCAAQGEHPTLPVVVGAATATEHAKYLVPVVRYGSFTLVELRPESSQRNLSLQIVDVVMPTHTSVAVGDGVLHHCRPDAAAAGWRIEGRLDA